MPKTFHRLKKKALVAAESRRLPTAGVDERGNPIVDDHHPAMTSRVKQRAADLASESGFAEAVADFDAKAAAFPSSPAIVASVLLERGEVIKPDLEEWERDYEEMILQRRRETAPEWPEELLKRIDRNPDLPPLPIQITFPAANRGVKEGVGPDAWLRSQEELREQIAEQRRLERLGQADTAARDSAEIETNPYADTGVVGLDGNITLDALEAGEGGGAGGGAEAEAGGGPSAYLKPPPRRTDNDRLRNTKSLDRAYDQRLIFCVKDKASGQWTVPHGEVAAGEGLRATVRRVAEEAYGGDLDAYYYGEHPLGVWLHEYSEEEKAATGRFGEKRFVFKAELMDGVAAGSSAVEDFQFLTRAEVRDSDLWAGIGGYGEYLLSLSEAGLGEEYWRNTEFLAARRGEGEEAEAAEQAEA